LTSTATVTKPGSMWHCKGDIANMRGTATSISVCVSTPLLNWSISVTPATPWLVWGLESP